MVAIMQGISPAVVMHLDDGSKIVAGVLSAFRNRRRGPQQQHIFL